MAVSQLSQFGLLGGFDGTKEEPEPFKSSDGSPCMRGFSGIRRKAGEPAGVYEITIDPNGPQLPENPQHGDIFTAGHLTVAPVNGGKNIGNVPTVINIAGGATTDVITIGISALIDGVWTPSDSKFWITIYRTN